MTYSLPFNLKQKPVNKYFDGGVIKFNVAEQHLYFTVKQITKTVNATVFKGEVKSKEHLDKLLAGKTLVEILTIEVVQ